MRRDRFDAEYEAARFAVDGTVTDTETIARVDDGTSWRAAVVASRSPPAACISRGARRPIRRPSRCRSSRAGRGLAAANAFLAPEENDSVELGTRWNLLGDSLSLTAAVFRIDKLNARVPDPESPGFNVLAGEFRERRLDAADLTRAPLRGTLNT